MSDMKPIEGVAGLKKYDIKVSTVVFMIYCLAAAGAFGIEDMIPTSGPGLTIAMLIVIPIVWAFPICLAVAEMGAILPEEGGVYVWVKEAFGEFWGFVIGWWETLAIYLSNALYVVLIVGYTEKFIPMNETQAYLLKVAIILIFTVINLMGIQEVGKVSTILSLMVLVAFGAIALVGIMHWQFNPVIPFTVEGMDFFHGLGGSLAIGLWMYCGYECLSTMAGEINNPQVIPKGILIAVPLIALSYILPTTAGLASIGNWDKWATDASGGTVGYVDVLIRYLGPAFGVVFLVVAIVAQASMLNAYMASGSRGFFVLADDHLCPRLLVKISKKRGVPYISILLLAVVTLLTCTFDFSVLVLFTAPLGTSIYIIMFLTIRKLREKYPITERKGLFVIPGGKIFFELVCTVPIIIGIINLLVNGTEFFLLGFTSLASGLIAYVFFKSIYGGLYKTDPINHPINPKTRLALGDVGRIGMFFLIFGIIAGFGSFFLTWYEGSEAAAYYFDIYGSGVLWGNFDLMIAIARYGGFAAIACGMILYFASGRIGRTPIVKQEK